MAQGGVAMNSSFQINICHGTFLENLSYWVLVLICRNLIKHWKKILNLWSYRDLTYIGKVTVIKTLALPILVQSLTVLPNSPDSILNDIENIFYKFLWNGKKDKIKRSIIINEYEEGGLKMPNIQSFYKALKMSWLHKLLDPFNHSPWKVLFIGFYTKMGRK